MKLRSKITIIILSVAIMSTILINIAFGIFFRNFILNQEQSRIQSIYKSLSSSLSEKEKSYLGSVKDWAHWDDTFNYVNNDDADYIKKNLQANSFDNLDISFVIFVNEDDLIFDKFYYDFEKEEMEVFPINFQNDFEKIISLPIFEGDMDGIYKIGNEFYFIASTYITDSSMQNRANTKMVFGRIIDKSVVEKIEKVTGCKVLLKATDVASQDILNTETDDIIFHNSTINEKGNTVNIEMIVPYASENNKATTFILIMTRDLYIAGMKNISLFVLLNSLLVIILFILLYVIIGKYISKPFVNLLKDVKNIDLKEMKINKLGIIGKDEFTFLRNSINIMLEKIEDEQSKVRDNEEKLYATLLSVGDGVISVDIDSKIQFMNPIAQQLTGWKQEDAFGEQIETIFNIVNENTKEKMKSPIKLVYETDSIIQLDNNALLIAKDGTEKPIEDSAAPIKDKFGILTGCVLVFRDFSEKKEKQKQIEHLSFHDQLTGLYNRRFLEEELKRFDTRKNLPISFIYADINGLKTINDAFGHSAGDVHIQKVADVFKEECRADDIIARTGGDEFIMLLPKTDICTAEIIAERIKEKVEMKKNMDINLSISLGWETKNAENQSAEDCMRTAEDFMYNRKFFTKFSKNSATIRSILNALYLKSPREAAHSTRVSILCETIGKAYNLNNAETNELKHAGELHDIGKIGVDESILNNTKKLYGNEWNQIKKHPEIGYRLLETSREFYNISELVLAHHERWDGSGYPKGLKGEDIKLGARIIAIADSFDAMTCERPYRKPLSEDMAIIEIKKNAGTQFDPVIARVFVEKVLFAEW